MKKSKEKTMVKNKKLIVICAIVGGIIGVLLGMYESETGNSILIGTGSMSLVLTLLTTYVATVFHTIIHEAGHMLFGLLSGYRFLSFRIFSFIWIKEDEKIKLKRLNLAGTDGQCLMAPPDLIDGKMPVVMYNMGGVLVNSIASVLFIISYLVWEQNALLLFAIIGIIVAVINGIPLRLGLINNDGYNALSAARNPKSVHALWTTLKIAEMNTLGKRLKEMPEEWFAMPEEEDMDNSLVATLSVFACNRLMDEMRFDEAATLMKQLLDSPNGIMGVYKNLMTCDLMFCEMIKDNRADTLEEWYTPDLKRFMNQMKTYPAIIRTEYVYALLHEKNRSKAKNVMERFEKTAKTFPHPQEIESERELIEIADKMYEETNTNTVVIRKIMD